MKNKRIFLFVVFVIGFAANALPSQYTDNNQGIVSFDVSMPIDATGYTLHGENLTGGDIQFTNQGTIITDFLAHETGEFKLPVVTSTDKSPLISTTVNYEAIKFINPIGISNFFIKIGVAKRTQKIASLDPKVLKNGTYTWQVPIFFVGKEQDTVNQHSENKQFTQVGCTGGPATSNDMYTEDFYLFTQADGNTAIVGHPQKSARVSEILSKAYSSRFNCHAHGIWGSGADPYRTMQGDCDGKTTIFPAGPNLDYEYGTFKLPTVSTPWTAAPSDHCLVNGKRHAGCVNAKVGSELHYLAQKIRVPINKTLSVYAEFGTVYRRLIPDNLRYQCKSNVYLKNILPLKDCLNKSYLAGGWSAPYFAVGFEFQTVDGSHYSARYIYIPEKENANRLAWLDASDTQIYAISVDSSSKTIKPSHEQIQENFNTALDFIRQNPALYKVLGEHFFIEILKKNGLYVKR